MARSPSARGLRASVNSLALAALLLAACQGDPPVHHYALPAFGTIVQVDIAGVDADTAAGAAAEIETLYQRLDRDWRSFGPGELGQVNDRLAAGRPAVLSDELRHVVARSLEVRTRSGGLFDPRIGSLIQLWGFSDMARVTPESPPDDAAIDAARTTAIEAAVLELDGNTLSSTAPVRLELAGIAKGSALMAGAAALRRRGVTNALIVAGGDVIALGRHKDRPWRVGVRDPLAPGIIGVVELDDGEAALSSGNYERRFESRGETFHHLLDPRTGRPARGAAGATVVARDADLANAAAATLLIGGPAGFADLTRRLGVDCALLVAENGERLLTPCMRERLRPP